MTALTGPEAAAGAGAGLAKPRRALAILTVLTSMLLVVLDAGATNMALPGIGRALGVAPAQAILVTTAYQAGLIVALLPAGLLGERFGHRRVFVAGVAVFGAAAALCAVSPTLAWLAAARFVQGLGGAAIMALGIALVRFAVPRSALGAAIGWNALTVALGSAAGPSLGAAVLAATDWRWIFALDAPLAVVALAASRALPSTPARATRLDLVSVAFHAFGFAALIVAAELALARPAIAAGLLAAAVACLAVLVRREAGKRAPLLPLDLLRDESFRLSVAASACCFAAQSAGLLALPFLLLRQFHLSPLAAGAYVTAWPLGVAAAAVAAGRLADRAPTAWLCAGGGALMSAGLAGLAAGSLEDGPERLVPFILLAGAGFGLFQTPNNRTMFLAAPADRSGAAGGLQGTARVSGQTLGALMMTLLFGFAGATAAPGAGLAIAAALALAAALVSLFRSLA